MRITITAIFLISIVCISCKRTNQQGWDDLPEVTNISKLQRTESVTTLECPINDNKNVIYATAFQYAWKSLIEKLNSPISLTKSSSSEFLLLNQSISYKNALMEDEYSADAEIVDDKIIAKAFFNKSLPFSSKLQKLDSPILFDKARVVAFGMQSYDYKIANFTEILSYKDDYHFILKLTPKDNQHEILLIKGISGIKNLSDAIKKTNNLIEAGKNEMKNVKESWKYSLNEIDTFSIPTIKFNLETNYSKIEGQEFDAKDKKYTVETAYQRTGFILNENGAVVESESRMIAADSTSEPIQIKAKKMVFDKPFFVIIKRVQTDNPYFVIYVQNNELLTKL